jgi:phospholipid/cholesterol/gamma-HCH transport system substrate-binding protein
MKIANEVKIGLLGLIALVTFVIGYNFLKGTGVFSSTKTVNVEYDNVQGLLVGGYVQINGLKVGSIKDIHFSKKNKGKIVVEMLVDKTISIPSDTKAIITSLDIMGTKAIDLAIGNSTTQLQNNEYLLSETKIGLIDELKGQVSPAITNIDKTVQSLDGVITNVESTLANTLDATAQNNIKKSIAEARASMEQISALTKELNNQKAKIGLMLSEANTFTANLNKNNPNLNGIINDAKQTTARLKDVEFERTVRELNVTISNLNTTLDKLNNGTGSMAMLMNDKKLYQNLTNTMETVNNLLYDINARPQRYVNLSLFGRKIKETSPPPPAPNSLK